MAQLSHSSQNPQVNFSFFLLYPLPLINQQILLTISTWHRSLFLYLYSHNILLHHCHFGQIFNCRIRNLRIQANGTEFIHIITFQLNYSRSLLMRKFASNFAYLYFLNPCWEDLNKSLIILFYRLKVFSGFRLFSRSNYLDFLDKVQLIVRTPLPLKISDTPFLCKLCSIINISRLNHALSFSWDVFLPTPSLLLLHGVNSALFISVYMPCPLEIFFCLPSSVWYTFSMCSQSVLHLHHHLLQCIGINSLPIVFALDGKLY